MSPILIGARFVRRVGMAALTVRRHFLISFGMFKKFTIVLATLLGWMTLFEQVNGSALGHNATSFVDGFYDDIEACPQGTFMSSYEYLVEYVDNSSEDEVSRRPQPHIFASCALNKLATPSDQGGDYDIRDGDTCKPGYAIILSQAMNDYLRFTCRNVNVAKGYALSDPYTVGFETFTNIDSYCNCNDGFLISFATTINTCTCVKVKATCYNGNNVPWGQASPDNSIRVYSSSECQQMGGNYYSNGECIKQEGGSWSWECRNLNNVTYNLMHSGGKCVHPLGGSPNPSESTPAVVHQLCDNEDRILYQFKNGNIIHKSSGMCLQSTSNGNNVVFGSDCKKPSAQFKWLPSGSLQHVQSGNCIHPSGGSPNPDDNTNLILYDLCDLSRLAFNASYPST